MKPLALPLLGALLCACTPERPPCSPGALVNLEAHYTLAELATDGAAWFDAPVQRVPVAGEPAVMIHHLDGWGAWAELTIRAVSLDEAQFSGVELQGGMSGSPIFGSDLALICVVTGGGVDTGLGYCAIPPAAANF